MLTLTQKAERFINCVSIYRNDTVIWNDSDWQICEKWGNVGKIV